MTGRSRQTRRWRPILETAAGARHAACWMLLLSVTTPAARGSDQARADRDPGVTPNQSVLLKDGSGHGTPVPDATTAAAGRSNKRGATRPSAMTNASPDPGTIRRIPRRSDPLIGAAHRGGASSQWGRGLGALAVVLAVVAVVFWAVRRWVPSVRRVEGGVMHVAGRISLTSKHHVALVQMGGRFLLVGIAPDGLSTLCEISDAEEVAELVRRIGGGSVPDGGAFDEQLLQEAGAYEAPPGERTTEPVRMTPRAKAGREPLTDLLRKLRKLRST